MIMKPSIATLLATVAISVHPVTAALVLPSRQGQQVVLQQGAGMPETRASQYRERPELTSGLSGRPSVLGGAPPLRQLPPRDAAGFIAFGDSYAAGIGTGFNGTEDDCRHGLHAYPSLIHRDFVDALGPNNTSFQFLSCTGAGVDDVLSGAESSQIDNLNITSTTDFALLSIGGNDLGFFDILNSCIYRFYSFYSGTCEDAIKKSEAALASPDFEHRLRLAITEILDRIQWEKRLWFTITITGYAQFFNAETEECDNCSFGVWWRGPKLERQLRQRINEMVLSVNDKIKRSIDSINSDFTEPKVYFVNYDHLFEGHRFCEPNVTEPDYGRNETWFFLVGGPDNGDPEGNMTAQGNQLLPNSSPLIDPEMCMKSAQRSGDWGQLALCMMASAARDDPQLVTAAGDVAAQNSMWYVPTYYGKTFHPVSTFWRCPTWRR